MLGIIIQTFLFTDAAFNFNKYNTDRIDSLGTPYDYKSMMHYGGKYFTTDWNKLTIQTLDPAMQDQIGQRNGFSDGDILQFNKMYCSGSTGGSSSSPFFRMKINASSTLKVKLCPEEFFANKRVKGIHFCGCCKFNVAATKK